MRSARDEDEEIRDIKTNDTYEIVQTGKQRKLFILLLTYLVGWLDKYIGSGVCVAKEANKVTWWRLVLSVELEIRG